MKNDEQASKQPEHQSGISYKHGYDIIFKWLTNIFTGETLDVLGVKTGKITEVRGLEPISLQVKQERVDILLKDEQDRYYHLEEQRNFSRHHLYRFAAQHYLVAEQIESDNLLTVIIVSGKVTPRTKIETIDGTFTPIIVDLMS